MLQGLVAELQAREKERRVLAVPWRGKSCRKNCKPRPRPPLREADYNYLCERRKIY